MNWDDTARRAALLRSRQLQALVAGAAAAVAYTEERLAQTYDHLAVTRPHDARRLQARAAQAREFAAIERRQAVRYNWTDASSGGRV